MKKITIDEALVHLNEILKSAKVPMKMAVLSTDKTLVLGLNRLGVPVYSVDTEGKDAIEIVRDVCNEILKERR